MKEICLYMDCDKEADFAVISKNLLWTTTCQDHLENALEICGLDAEVEPIL